PGDPTPSIKRFRLRTRTLAILVAYIALVLGLGIQATRWSVRAQQYQAKAASAVALAHFYQRQVARLEADLQPAENARELRAGRIPDGLLTAQKEFLKGLAGTTTKAYREYLYGLIADAEEQQARLTGQKLPRFRRVVRYQQELAAKYSQGARRPWMPVAP